MKGIFNTEDSESTGERRTKRGKRQCALGDGLGDAGDWYTKPRSLRFVARRARAARKKMTG
jgi:hypothetical protein